MRLLITFLAVLSVWASGNDKYEVWAIDQSNSAGKAYGGTIYIWDGHDLENKSNHAVAEKVDLGGAGAAFCFAQTGANPVRPHMLTMNRSNTHAIISFVASGHVLFLNAETRQPVSCIRTSIGSTGARQVHQSFPSPDETYVAVANQNGKLYERINTDYPANSFVLDPAATIDLATCTTPNAQPCEAPGLRPDNAPICPIIDSSGVLNFVTLRGGGLFVIDGKSTPMRIVGEYDNSTVHPNGCLGAETRDKMYIDSGGGTPANLHEADLYAFPLGPGLYSSGNGPNLPVRKLIFSEDVEGADTHGASLTKHNKFLWIADRGRNFVFVVDTENDTVVNRINLLPGLQDTLQQASLSVGGGALDVFGRKQRDSGVGDLSDDPTPDLLFMAPNGSHMFMSMRGPNPLTADPHVSTGAVPGVGVVKITKGGRNGVFESVAAMSNIDSEGVERADAHALWVRLKRR